MHSLEHLWRQAALAVGIAAAGVLLAFGGTPAFASSLVAIYGSGASLQGPLQTDILIPDAPSPLDTLVTYTSTTSGDGALEFGLTGSGLNLAEDSGHGQLDAYVGVNSPPSSTELTDASLASQSGLTANLVTDPVAQTSLDIVASLPVGVQLDMSEEQQINLTNLLLGQLFAGTVPAAGGYAKNTWGALLTDAGLTETSSTPSANLFSDSGSGSDTIDIETRKNGAGTTLNLKQYASAVELDRLELDPGQRERILSRLVSRVAVNCDYLAVAGLKHRCGRGVSRRGHAR